MARKTGSHSDITGPKIRAAALSLFAREGYAAVSMRRIASEVGLAPGALYLYTPDKQGLLFDLLNAHMDELLAAWEALAKPAGPAARLLQFVRFHILHHLDRPEAVFIAYMELRNLTEENFKTIGNLRRRYEDALEDILKAGDADGTFAVPDTKLATLAVIAMLTGVNTWYRSKGRLGRDRVVDIYWDMIRRAVSA